MKPAHVNKLYTKLTPQEQANLVLEAAVSGDEGAVDAILANVKRVQYLAIHSDYTRHMHGLMLLIGQYGIEYWKNLALMLATNEYADLGNPKAEETARRFYAKFQALDSAIVEVCKQLNVDVSAVKKMADCSDGEIKLDKLRDVDEKLVKEYVVMFWGLFPGRVNYPHENSPQ